MTRASVRDRAAILDLARGLTIFGVVLIHVVLMFGLDAAVWYVRIRDFAFPVIVLSSFYALTVASARSASGLAGRVARRTRRLLVPAVVWSAIYWYGWSPLVAVFEGTHPTLVDSPPLQLFVGGFMHLWYVQFLFYSSVAILIVLRLGARSALRGLIWQPWIWLAAAIIYRGWLMDSLLAQFAPPDQPGLVSWLVFERQSLIHAAYIPLGVALGFGAQRIVAAGCDPRVRYGVLLAAFAAALTYTWGPRWPFAREWYGLVVFLTMLMPWTVPQGRVWKALAAESYGVYILHYAISQVSVVIVLRFFGKAATPLVLLTAVVAYASSLAAAVGLRTIASVEWLLPRIQARHDRPVRLAIAAMAVKSP